MAGTSVWVAVMSGAGIELFVQPAATRAAALACLVGQIDDAEWRAYAASPSVRAEFGDLPADKWATPAERVLTAWVGDVEPSDDRTVTFGRGQDVFAAVLLRDVAGEPERPR